jgi:hypothetical protein
LEDGGGSGSGSGVGVGGEDGGKGGEGEGIWLKGAAGGRGNKFRLERFGKAMSGSCAWDPPGGLLNGKSPLHPSLSRNLRTEDSWGLLAIMNYEFLAGLDWSALPAGSTIVDVGGGIGSQSMLLAEAFGCAGGGEGGAGGGGKGLKFVVQDREAVVAMGVKVRPPPSFFFKGGEWELTFLFGGGCLFFIL